MVANFGAVTFHELIPFCLHLTWASIGLGLFQCEASSVFFMEDLFFDSRLSAHISHCSFYVAQIVSSSNTLFFPLPLDPLSGSNTLTYSFASRKFLKSLVSVGCLLICEIVLDFIIFCF